MSSSPIYDMSNSDNESGYGSAAASEASLSEIYFTKPHLAFLNKQLSQLEPQEILRWAILTLPNLYQTTAFGLTGLVTIDMLSKMYPDQSPIDLIFLDTLHHFTETLALVDRVKSQYPSVKLHVYQPQGASTADQFAELYGAALWSTDDERYDFLAKVEPAQRAYAQLNVRAVLTGRRRSQGGARGDINIIEIDETGLVKVNPLANWNFKQVKEYVDANQVPYNELLDRGYKSVGDWHSTQPVAEGEDERSGRWKGQNKTECGIHNSKSRYALFLMEQEAKRKAEEVEAALKAMLPAEENIVAPAEEIVAEPVQENVPSVQENIVSPVQDVVMQPVEEIVDIPTLEKEVAKTIQIQPLVLV